MNRATMQADIQKVYALAEEGGGLPQLLDAICQVLARYPRELAELTHSYRLQATDTGYMAAFALRGGVLGRVEENAPVDVTLLGKEADLLDVFRRKVTPLKALLFGKIKLQGDKGALLKLGEFL